MTQPHAKLPTSFTTAQLDKVMVAARSLPVESRDAFLRLIADQLKSGTSTSSTRFGERCAI